MFKVLATSPTQVDAVGFKARLQGFAVRDCFLVLEPDNNVSLGLLVRSESNSSILDEAVRTGSGVLDIDAGRIGSEVRTYDIKGGENLNQLSRVGKGDREDSKGMGAYGIGAKQISIGKATVAGRFPSNLILQHTPSCTMEGTKKVKPSNGSGTAHQDNRDGELHQYRTYGAYRKLPQPNQGFVSEDGTEEVANWVCQPGCPVAEMDRQSGNLGNGFRPNHKTAQVGDRRHVTYEVSAGVGRFTAGFNDSGGASRFFKQVQTDTELEEYLDTLIRKP